MKEDIYDKIHALQMLPKQMSVQIEEIRKEMISSIDMQNKRIESGLKEIQLNVGEIHSEVQALSNKRLR